MKTMKWISWCSAVLLVGSLMWTTGCGGSSGDGGGGTTTIVVTNAAGETTTVVVTNEPAAAALVAPQQVMPHAGQEFGSIIVIVPLDIDFQWTAVPGASSYVLQVNGQSYQVNGTTKTVSLAIGDHKWRVNAVSGEGAKGPVSGWVNFKVKFEPIEVFEI